jgi:hypothetical protein
VVARVVLVALSVAVIAWCGVRLIGTGAQADLDRIAFGAGFPSTPERVDDLVTGASRLTPDPRPRMYRAAIAIRADDLAAATRELRAVVADEPENLEAWSLLARAADGVDPVLAARAAARARELAPPVPPAP